MYSQSVVPNASRYTMSINLARNVITHWFPVQFKTTLCAAEPISSNGWRLGGGYSGGQYIPARGRDDSINVTEVF